MALVDLKSNLANFRSEFKTPSVESQAVKKLNQPSAIKDKFPANDSNLDIDTTPDKFIAIGKSKLSNNKFIKTSVFNIDSNPELYNRKTKFTKRFVDRSEFNREDNFILKYTGRTRFTTKYVNSFSKFNIDTTPDKFIVSGFSKLSLPRFVNRSQFNIDSTLSKFSPTGVYLPSKFTNTKIINASKYNLDNSPNKHGNDSNKTNFKGISGRSFKFPNILTAVFRTNAVELKNSKFGSRGFATVENQLGAGSLFHYTIKGAKNNKLFSSRGYGEQLKYGDVIRGGRGSQESNSLLYRKATEQNSPSAIDEQYKKFNLRDEAFNYSYINHPLILRGIQRKGKEKPNRWGIDKLVNFDSGLVRGGITAAVERAANDTARIAKWVASPKGLLWVVKQVGLGLSNPKVEATGGPLTRQTKIHTGIASLLSVPTTAFGLHFTRHGIPFLNEVASYENVSKKKNNELTYNLPDPSGILVPGNRLIALKNEYAAGETITNKVKEVLTKVKILKTKSFGSNILFSLGGAQSVYGIGFTAIRRTTDTFTDSVKNAKDQNFHSIYSAQNPYNLELANSTYSATKLQPKTNKKADTNLIDKSGNPIGKLANIVSDVQEAFAEINKPRKPTLFGLASRYLSSRKIDGPTTSKSIYRPKKSSNDVIDESAKDLIKRKAYELNLYVSALKAKTGKQFDSLNSTGVLRTVQNLDTDDKSSLRQFTKKIIKDAKGEIILPNSNVPKPNNPFKRSRDKEGGGTHALEEIENASANIKNYATIAYGKLKDQKPSAAVPNDFRNSIKGTGRYIGKQDKEYYQKNNLETAYGFSKAGPDSSVTARGPKSFIHTGKTFNGTNANAWQLNNNTTFTGDKITSIDIIKDFTESNDIYTKAGVKDFVKFYFADGEMQGNKLRRIMAFRATITGLSDTFSPNWGSIQIMGRPDSVYRYESFERSISFNFKAYAMTRSEMIPMWRKLNYLASFTAPDFVGGYVAGPFMRLTLGDMYHDCPGFIESLSYTIPDDAVWDIADDDAEDAKQLPTMIDVSVGYKIIGTHRPINMGRMYALSNNDSVSEGAGQWLGNSNKYEDPGVDEGGFTKGTGDPENTTENTGFTGNQGLGQGDNNIA